MVNLALFFVFGAWLFQFMPSLPNLYWFFLDPFLILLFVIAVRTEWSFLFKYKKIIFVLLAFCIGFSWAALAAIYRLSDALPAEWETKPIQIVGVVSSLPQSLENGTRFEMDVEKILTPHAVVPHKISLSQYKNQSSPNDGLISFHAGERWRLNIKLKRPHTAMNPNGFDFEVWALERNIRATGSIKQGFGNQRLNRMVYRPHYLLESARESIYKRIKSVLGDKPYTGILQALVIGDESGISQESWQVFLRTGTNHLMSISGLHITMLSGLAYTLIFALWRRSERLTLCLPARKAAVLDGLLVAFLYALIAGFTIPTQRTVLMLFVFGLALWSGRHVQIFRVLIYSLFLVVLWDPWAVHSPGFWLSFGAVAVITFCVAGRLVGLSWIKGALKTQWAVTIGLVPLLLMLFQQVSIISPIANAIAIPVISTVVVPLSLIGGLLPIDSALLLAHWVMANAMWFLQFLADLPLSTWQQHAPPTWTVLMALFGILWLLSPKGVPLRIFGWIFCLPVIFIVPEAPPVGAMTVTVLDVGQGLAVVIKTNRHQILYDAGPKYGQQSDSGGRIILPYLRGQGIKNLDLMMVSHNDNDHSGGMSSVLKQMPVNWLVSSFAVDGPEIQSLKYDFCVAGQRWDWDGVAFEILSPTIESYDDASMSDNNRSCVLKINSAYGSILLTGDIERQAEDFLVDAHLQELRSNVLVVPHHGSKTSSSPAFINAVQPRFAVFTAGYLNRFGHPKAEIQSRYMGRNIQTYRSDEDGAVIFAFTKSGIDLTRWREYAKRYWHNPSALAEKAVTR
jgi:competence protein ComEC